jgi:hypothetical protein
LVVFWEPRTEGLFNRAALTGRQIDAQRSGDGDKVPPGMAIAGGKLIHELFDTGSSFCYKLFALADFYSFIQRFLERRLEVRGDRSRFALRTSWVPALARLELICSAAGRSRPGIRRRVQRPSGLCADQSVRRRCAD